MRFFERIIILVLVASIFLGLGCKRSVFEDNQNPENQTSLQTGQKITLELQQDTETMLYPENGQAGGIGKNTEGKIFRAYLKRNTETGIWYAYAQIFDTVTGRPIKNAKITINCRVDKNNYLAYNLTESDIGARYFIKKLNAPFKSGKKAGYFHVVHSSGFEFKLGFGIQRLEINQVSINGISTTGGINLIRIPVGSDINITTTCSGGLYYELILNGTAGQWHCLNYYAPSGLIIIKSQVTSKFLPDTYGNIFVRPHLVYVAKGFTVPQYPDKTQQISMVSVSDGSKLGIGALVHFR